MSVVTTIGPTHPRLGRLGMALGLPLFRWLCGRSGVHGADSALARERVLALGERLARGETAWILGIGPAGHNAGASLVEVSARDGVRLHTNDEEERYTGVKHFSGYPEQSVAAVKRRMDRLGVRVADLHAVVASYDFVRFFAMHVRSFLEEFPYNFAMIPRGAAVGAVPTELRTDAYGALFHARRRLIEQLGGDVPPILGMSHHGNHAAFSYAASPFAHDAGPVLVAVIDGAGDDEAISLWEGRAGRLRKLWSNQSSWDSLGLLYGILSSTQGGWTMLSSEGRSMGAAAWGDGDRRTNPYYHGLRQILWLGPDGDVRLNRALANWHRGFVFEPYTPALTALLGPAIGLAQMWQPDRVLDLDRVEHAEATRERVDKAAALQLVFEDGLFHLIASFVRRTGSQRLVLTGGAALNAVGSMRLLQQLDEAWYARQLGQKGRLHLWVPPIPGDAGMPVGAAYQLALRAGAPPGPPLEHAFWCGEAATRAEVDSALEAPDLDQRSIGDLGSVDGVAACGDAIARAVSGGCIVGLYQGAAETGPRALGHRSILANPCDPRARERLNAQVKHRERIRPLAPMATKEAAERWFELSEGASDGDFNAYRYMVLTAPARAGAHEVIPAVIHRDGTGRVQIVPPDTDPLTHAYLRAMGRRVGVEVSVNTSLNVGSPIAQTPQQAVETLRRSRGMDGIFFVSADGSVRVAWHRETGGARDGGARLRRELG